MARGDWGRVPCSCVGGRGRSQWLITERWKHLCHVISEAAILNDAIFKPSTPVHSLSVVQAAQLPVSVPLPCFVDSTPLHNIYPSSTYCVTDAADLHMSLLQFSGRPSFNYVKFTLSIITLSNSLLWPRAGSKHSINRTVSTVLTVLTKNIINSINSEKN